MGIGGKIKIVNRTQRQFTLKGKHSYQMAAWNWDENIPAGATQTQYVEFEVRPYDGDDAGEALFSIEGTNAQFQIRARSEGLGRHRLELLTENFDAMQIPGYTSIKRGEPFCIGWEVNGVVWLYILCVDDKHYKVSVLVEHSDIQILSA